MSIKNLVEMIKRNGLLASMPQLEELYQVAIENELKLAESQREFRAADATIENLQMQVEKLAAENAGMKSIQEWAVAGVFKSGAKVFESTKASGFDTDDCLHDAVLVMLSELKTPATEAVLAEVRASGVEMFAKEMHADVSGDDAREFAAQLRKGVQS